MIIAKDVKDVAVSTAYRTVGDMVFFGGVQAPEDDSGYIQGDVTQQTQAVFKIIEENLKAAGTSMKNVVKVNGYLSDTKDFDAFNTEYAKHFPMNDPTSPARSMAVTLVDADPGVRINLEIVAKLSDEQLE